MKILSLKLLLVGVLGSFLISPASAEPWAAPGDMCLRHDLQLLNDEDVTNLPLTTWPLSWRDISHAVLDVLPNPTSFERTDSACHEGGIGFADIKPNCAYEHGIYQTGYRYKHKVLGYAMDGDGLSYSLGSTLVQSAGHSWNILLRYMEINRVGAPIQRHTISPTPQEQIDILLTHTGETSVGRFDLGLGYGQLDDAACNSSTDDVTEFFQRRTF